MKIFFWLMIALSIFLIATLGPLGLGIDVIIWFLYGFSITT